MDNWVAIVEVVVKFHTDRQLQTVQNHSGHPRGGEVIHRPESAHRQCWLYMVLRLSKNPKKIYIYIIYIYILENAKIWAGYGL